MVLLTAAPRHAAGYALLELGAASLRVSLPDEVAQSHSEERPAKRPRTSKEGDDEGGIENESKGVGGAAVSENTAPVEALSTGQQDEAAAPNAGIASLPTDPPVLTENIPGPDGELPSVHSSSRMGARVTSSSAATAPADPSAPLFSMPNLIARGRADGHAVSGSKAAEASASHRGNRRRIYVADQILDSCSDYSSLHLRSPLERGFITDWAAQKVILDRAISVSLAGRTLAPRQPMPYSHAMAARTAKTTGMTAAEVSVFEFGIDLESRLLEERTVIFTEPYFNFPDSAATTDTILFEQYGVAAVWRATPAQLVPFAPIFPKKSQQSPPQQDSHSRNTTGLSAPDCLLVVDLGHSSTNVVPLICAQAQWNAARRLDVGGKLLTNLLKETLSFRQWDMMDETWLIQAIKERCCFLAPGPGIVVDRQAGTAENVGNVTRSSFSSLLTSGIIPPASDTNITRRRRNEVLRLIRTVPPSQWGLGLLVELCKHFPASNPVTQDYTLPDYSESDSNHAKRPGKESASRSARTLGYVRRGSGSESAKAIASRRRTRRRENVAEDDDMIADLSIPCERKTPKKRSHQGLFLLASQADDSESEDDDAEDDEDDDDDFDPEKNDGGNGKGGSDSGGESAGSEDEDDDEDGASSGGDEEDYDAQVLKMGTERFSIPEVLFAPGRIGLGEAPLHEVIAESIRACPEDVRDMMWSNIVLVGGGARLPGLRRRLENELRSLAPEDAIIHIWEYAEPENAAAHGALALLSAPSNSPEARFFRAHLVTRTEWASAGAAVCRARFGGWMAMHDGSLHIRREDGDEDEEEDGEENTEARFRPSVNEPAATGPRTIVAKGKGKERARPARTTVTAAAPTLIAQPTGRSTTSAQDGEGPPQKKKRGRPKGSKNIKKPSLS
ncbi:hypothetical protein A4X13_0g882 [Tilletia indica]|uniref:Actin-related protein 8 n=1 Tax=Tilletia indica TaxID=43049 RepID=A0A177TGF6_9BASI|nr:hypothetical protein A4X13_0g882 [Tilletia indica]